ncbi:hypothetical protein [Halapricum salinum]|uniref:Uncharacterized protein n=1 Tax=Halapricum salinum TaxID=1457250 RepID=A0A4D6H860_9EURY|nr:hypothetical protein [Halapricum salinum]QCC49805.1 hypothetical protein DV733_00570 [Halapricum salinum]
MDESDVENRDILAAVGAVVIAIGVMTAFDLARGAAIAWVLNVGVAAVIGLFVFSARAAA